MRQRNDTGYTQHVMAWPTPFEVGHGEIIDHPTLLAGFTAAPEPAARPKKTAAAPAATPETKGGEPE